MLTMLLLLSLANKTCQVGFPPNDYIYLLKSTTIMNLQNCAKLKLRNMAIIYELTFADDCVNSGFSRKTDAQRKQNFAFCSAKLHNSFSNGNPTVRGI